MKYIEERGLLYLGDACEILPTLPDNSVDLCLTDPPFFIRRQVIIHRSVNPVKYKGKDIISGGWEWDTFPSEEAYKEFTFRWYKEVCRILRVGGHFVSFFDRLRVHYLHEFGQRFKMITRQPLYYLIENPVPRARKVDFVGSLLSLFWATKETYSRKVSTFNYQLGMRKNYIVAPICGGKERIKLYDGTVHPAQKPEAVAEWIISYLSNEGDTILDPFMGMGTFPAVAKRLNRRFIGIEINPQFFEKAKERITKTGTQPALINMRVS